MNRPIRTLAVGFLVLFLGLLGRATYLQFFDASNLDSLTAHADNGRALSDSYNRPRGQILVPGLKSPIAESKPVGDQYKFQRVYPYGAEYADVTGYFAIQGNYAPLAGLEYSRNKALSGEDDQLFLRHLSDILSNKQTPGENVILTLNPTAQKAAFAGLQKLKRQHVVGSVIALEPSTGRVLAMASTPTYDPNALAVHNSTKVADLTGKMLGESFGSQGYGPFNNPSIQTALPPGSTFKLVTAAAALSSGKYNANSLVSGDSRWKLPGTNTYLPNEEGQSCGATKVTMTLALANSCNVAFGQLGDALGNAAISSQAEKFGFGQRYFTELDDTLVHQSTSVFPSNANRPNTVLSAIGQYETTATPLQMALVAAGIANGGTVMSPYLINGIQAPNLNMVYQAKPAPLNDLQPAISSSVATQLTQMMSAVVQYGTGTTAQIPGIQVAGKTGTAQSCNTCNPYSWFVSFGPTDNAKVAVAVQLQFLEQPSTTRAMNALDTALGIRPGSGTYVARSNITGRGFAAPVAKCVMEAVITPDNLTADCKA